MDVWTVNQASGFPVQRAARNPVIFDMEKRHGDKLVKHVKVMKSVYEPRRLRQAWQQVKQNAGQRE